MNKQTDTPDGRRRGQKRLHIDLEGKEDVKQAKRPKASVDSSGLLVHDSGIANVPSNPRHTKEMAAESPGGDSAYDSFHPTPGYISVADGTPDAPDGHLQVHSNRPCGSSVAKQISFGQSHDSITEPLRSVYKLFKRNVRAKDVVPKFYQEDYLSREFYEKIMETQSRDRQSDLLIKGIIKSKKGREPGAIRMVVETLKDARYQHIAERIEEFRTHTQEENCGRVEEPEQSDKTKVAVMNGLHKALPVMERDLEPKDLIDDLLMSGMLSFDDHEDIFEIAGRLKRVSSLVDYIVVDAVRNVALLSDALAKQTRFSKIHEALTSCQIPSDDIDETMDLQQQIRLRFRKGTCKRKPFASQINVAITLKFDGEKTKVAAVEEKVVGENERKLNSELQALVMEELVGRIENMKICCIRLEVQSMSPACGRILQTLYENNRMVPFMQRLLQRLLSEGCVSQLKEAGTRRVTLEIHAETKPCKTTDKVKCIGALNREFIVNHFSDLEMKMPDALEFRDAFLSHMSVTADERMKLTEVFKQDKTSRNVKFLQLLLQLPSRYICLLERELRRLKMESLIQELTGDSYVQKDETGKINDQTIIKNYSYLLEELEPKDFVQAFEMSGLPVDIKKMMAESHEERTKYFLEILMKPVKERGKHVRRNSLLGFVVDTVMLFGRAFCRKRSREIDLFVSEAKKQGMTLLLEVLVSTPDEAEMSSSNGYSALRQKILKNVGTILEEIDPRKVEKMFVERLIFSSQDFFMMYEESESRFEIAVAFLDQLLTKGEDALKCLMVSLKVAGYEDVVKAIQDTPDEYIECPCLTADESSPTNSTATSLASAEFDLQFVQGPVQESNLQLRIHQALYGTDDAGVAVDTSAVDVEDRNSEFVCHLDLNDLLVQTDLTKLPSVDKTTYIEEWRATVSGQPAPPTADPEPASVSSGSYPTHPESENDTTLDLSLVDSGVELTIPEIAEPEVDGVCPILHGPFGPRAIFSLVEERGQLSPTVGSSLSTGSSSPTSLSPGKPQTRNYPILRRQLQKRRKPTSTVTNRRAT